MALAAAVLSFAGLHELAITAGFHPYIAPLFPLATDVAVAAFSLAVLHHRLTGLRVWYPWMCMMLGVAVSIAGNVWSAPADLVSRLVHAWPPLVFALAFEALTRLIRHRIDYGIDRTQARAVEDQSSSPAQDAPERAAPIVAGDWTPAGLAPATGRHSSHPSDTPMWTSVVTTRVPAPPAPAEVAVPDPAPERATDLDAPSVPAAPAAEPEPQDAPPTPVQTFDQPSREPVAPVSQTRPAVAADDTLDVPLPASARTGTLRSRLEALLAAEPNLPQADAARRLGADPSNVSKAFKKLRTERPDLFLEVTHGR